MERKHQGRIRLVPEPQPAALYREAFLRATSHLGITRARACELVESLSGCPFEECGWQELEPAIRHLERFVDNVLTAQAVRSERCD